MPLSHLRRATPAHASRLIASLPSAADAPMLPAARHARPPRVRLASLAILPPVRERHTRIHVHAMRPIGPGGPTHVIVAGAPRSSSSSTPAPRRASPSSSATGSPRSSASGSTSSDSRPVRRWCSLTLSTRYGHPPPPIHTSRVAHPSPLAALSRAQRREREVTRRDASSWCAANALPYFETHAKDSSGWRHMLAHLAHACLETPIAREQARACWGGHADRRLRQ